jgi:hypothetical protein
VAEPAAPAPSSLPAAPPSSLPAAPPSSPASPPSSSLPAPSPPSLPAPASAAPAPPRTGVDTGAPTAVHDRFGAPRYRDAHHDRLLFAPTAETNPQGSFYATSYYILVLQLGYSITDNTQISITGTPPLGEDGVIPSDISVKTVLLRRPRVSVAAIASASGILGVEEFSGFLGRAGGVATFCADVVACRLTFSMSSDIALAGPASVSFNGVGVSFRAGRIVSLIAELDSAIPLNERVGESNGLLGGAGVRLSGRAWGVDFGMMLAGKARAEPSGLLPFLAGTYRYVP